MPFFPVKVPPGVVKVDSDLAATGRWIDADKVRFVRGMPEKVGGVQKLITDQFTGIARGAKAWNTYGGVNCLAFGTACNLYLVRNGTLNEITPYRSDATSISLTNPFETTNTSAIVTVTDASHGIEAAGTDVVFSGASAVGGITIDGEYAVTEVVDADTYTITHSSAATSSATGGGSVTANYELNCGNVDPTTLLGWGVGGWGQGYWGTDVSASSAITADITSWALDPYGEDLVVNPLDGGIYIYDSSAGVQRPTLLSNAPAVSRYAFVTGERYIFALGCTTIAGSQDNMTVRWPDVEDNTDWTPSSTNTANERKLQGGTRLMAGSSLGDGLALVWSDAACFRFQYTGSNEVYASNKIADHCGLVGPLAFTAANGQAFWMGAGEFWMYAGFVQPIPNAQDVSDWVYRNINTTHISKSFCLYNPLFNEVWFVFPTGVATEPDTYVHVNLDTFAWTPGTWDRSSAAQYWTGERRPVMFGTDGYVYLHDVSTNPDEDSSAMEAYIELGATDIQGGNSSVDIFGFVPDFQRQTGDMTLYIWGRDHPRDSDFMTDTVTIESSDKLVDTRCAGRQFGFKLTTNTLGGDFRLGKSALEVSGAGSQR
ncbi:hypothetical protein [Pseudohoeflea coraliihabitans]|uniref:Uncharacterized protein n=1 Tax=Pseudohoeflea coraliihabitans TaxID=2860393 RepID=A0ABS6WTA7_9HYPH|nr:hypothetical protein [Pseudohoeflea sp. DP4N28-3]MBW3099191.1 hypothetical protein [Pseudohoeflea sp. DP4N28-3]